jgi:small subunit ribosomal protein S1
MVAIGDVVDVVVLNVNAQKQEISLGMKQIEENPWDTVREKYPVGTIIRGQVRNLTTYGAFVEIEEGIDGLLHVSDMSWTRKINHPNEVVKKGEQIEAIVLEVDQDKKRIALGTKQLSEDPWDYEIPNRYLVGADLEGAVTKITNFGVFVELESDLEGLLHISELSETKVDNPEEVVSVGDRVKVKVIKVNPDERKIGLTLLEVIGGGAESAKTEASSSEAADADDIKSLISSTGGEVASEEEEAEEASEDGPTEDPSEDEEKVD